MTLTASLIGIAVTLIVYGLTMALADAANQRARAAARFRAVLERTRPAEQIR